MTKMDFINYIKGLIYQYKENYKDYTADEMRNEIIGDFQSIIRLVEAKKIED